MAHSDRVFTEIKVKTMTVGDARITRSYHQEDIQQILQIAIARQAYEGEFSREQLLEIAAELEISSECLQTAEREWLAQQSELQMRQAFNAHRRNKLRQHFGKFIIVNSFVVLLERVITSHIYWSLYILLLWGLGLGFKIWNTYQSDGEEYEKAFQRWSRKQRLRQSFNSAFNKLLKLWQL